MSQLPLTGDRLGVRASLLKREGASFVAMVIAVFVFWRTAYPTINWWDSAQYSLATGTLGIAGPPGSLLLTLLGWPFTRLPLGFAPAHTLNLLAGMLAALTTGLVYSIALRLLRISLPTSAKRTKSSVVAIGAAVGALSFAFGATLWAYAVQFTPYVLSAVFTALILWTMLRWWQDADHPDAWRWLALLGLLFGLDYSVHRTNALLLPGALAWVLLRRSRTLLRPKSILAAGAGLLVGLAVQLLIIPIGRGAMTRSPLFWNDPIDWSHFWNYTSLNNLGGGFLIQFFPRKADFWSVQVADLLHVLGTNFLHWSGPASVLGVIPACAALLGLATLWRRDRRLGIAYAIVLFVQATMTVLYFNIPANFFRTFDRHYLPVCVTIAVLVAYGLAAAMEAVTQLSLKRMWVAAVSVGVLAILGPLSQMLDNWTARDASKRYFTREFATNLLASLPRNAILFTAGDNDTFPLLYVQAVEGIRQDVTIINMSVANLPEFAEELSRRDPSFPLAFSRTERDSVGALDSTPRTITIPVSGTAESLGLAVGAKVPDAITVAVRPEYGPHMSPADITVLDIARTNRWRRPLCFAITTTRQGMAWLERYGRLEGLYWRIVPTADPGPNVPLLRANLLLRAEYRGYADRAVQLDNESRTLGIQSYVALGGLLEADRRTGDIKGCRADLTALFAAIPPERVVLPTSYRQQMVSECAARNLKATGDASLWR